MAAESCVEALVDPYAESGCWLGIIKTGQGCQVTSRAWPGALQEAGVRIGVAGKSWWTDNVFIERLWRSLKYEETHLREYLDLAQFEAADHH